MDNILPLKTKVEILFLEENRVATGTIVGHGFMDLNRQDHNLYTCYLVELDKGFYNEEQTIFVKILPVHHENVRPIA